jgi:hypothetical protein
VSRVYKDWYPGKVKIEPEGRSADVFKQKAKSAANVEHYLRVGRRGRLPTAVCRPVVLEVDTRRGAEVEIRKREQEQFSEEIKSPGNRLVRAGPMMVDFMVVLEPRVWQQRARRQGKSAYCLNKPILIKHLKLGECPVRKQLL